MHFPKPTVGNLSGKEERDPQPIAFIEDRHRHFVPKFQDRGLPLPHTNWHIRKGLFPKLSFFRQVTITAEVCSLYWSNPPLSPYARFWGDY